MRRRQRYIIRGIAGTGLCLFVGAPWVRSLSTPNAGGAERTNQLAMLQEGKPRVAASTLPAKRGVDPSAASGRAAPQSGATASAGARLLPGHVHLPVSKMPQEPSVLPAQVSPNLHASGLAAIADDPHWLPRALPAASPRPLPRDGQHSIAPPPAPAVALLSPDLPVELPTPLRLGGALVAPSPALDTARLFVAPPQAAANGWNQAQIDPARQAAFQTAAQRPAPLRVTPAASSYDLSVPTPEDRAPGIASRNIAAESEAPIDVGDPPEHLTLKPVR